MPAAARDHAFVRHPHRTLLGLTLPVLLSLIAEPLTGIVDTAFVSRIGAVPVAALGVATVLLSSIFWVFNFLGIGTQTSVGRAVGAGRALEAREIASTAMATALLLGVILAILAAPWLTELCHFMGAEGAMLDGAVTYLGIRLFSAPAILVMLASFGVLRGLQDMRTPFWVAAGLNVMNAILAPLLIFGAGPIPPFGLAGAGWATVASQWVGASWAVIAARRAVGGSAQLRARDVLDLFVVGRDLVLRTGSLLLFLLLATRVATRIGADAGAAHQAIRQVWMLGAFLLDAWAASAQSLVSFFLGAGEREIARRVAGVACGWALLAGALVSVAMLVGTNGIEWLLVPLPAQAAFASAWSIAALAQPLNALSFVTDGIHWGAGDYRYLRNVMMLATAMGIAVLFSLDLQAASAFPLLWLTTVLWIVIRAAFGVARVWPGIGRAPLSKKQSGTSTT